jgi:hypothetical protein
MSRLWSFFANALAPRLVLVNTIERVTLSPEITFTKRSIFSPRSIIRTLWSIRLTLVVLGVTLT